MQDLLYFLLLFICAPWKVQPVFMRAQHCFGIRLRHSIIVLLQDCPGGANISSNGILQSLWEHLSCFVVPQQTTETFHLFLTPFVRVSDADQTHHFNLSSR